VKPLTCHWYTGLPPPFDAVELKVTWVPEQTLFEGEGVMVMLTAGLGVTVTG
jgi:hypothetical protein